VKTVMTLDSSEFGNFVIPLIDKPSMLQFVGVTSNPAETKTTSAKESNSNIAGSNTYARMVVYHVSQEDKYLITTNLRASSISIGNLIHVV
jgi:hypothetical protein